jgi:hypothetical protein
MKSDKEFVFVVKAFLMALLFVSSLFWGIAGALQVTNNGKCKINSIIKLHPAYWIGCELFKERDWR